jgi:nitrate reductase gamma subunit
MKSKLNKLGIIANYTNGNKFVRILILIGTFFLMIGLFAMIVGVIFYPRIEDMVHKEAQIILIIILIAFSVGASLLSSAKAYNQKLKEQEKEIIINEQEKKVAENPKEPKLAWDLARIKLESYLDRNLSQIKSIYHLSIFAMIIGFGLIIYGSYMSFQQKDNIEPAIITAISGLIVNFIGATFLVMYKSTMEQAKDYVNVLERINAVGMSVQIIESIDEKHLQLKEETKADLSKKLIELYSTK